MLQISPTICLQRHMVDSGRCKMPYEDNEEEYADFYEYEDEEESGSTAQVRLYTLAEIKDCADYQFRSISSRLVIKALCTQRWKQCKEQERPGNCVPGLFRSFFGFDKARESYRILKLFGQFVYVQFRNWRILLVSVVIPVQNMLEMS